MGLSNRTATSEESSFNNTNTVAHTPAGTPSVAYAIVTFIEGGVLSTAPTYAGATMTLVGQSTSGGSNIHESIWRKTSPSSGTQNCVVAANPSSYSHVTVVTYEGSDTSTPESGLVQGDSTTGNRSVNISSATGDEVLFGYGHRFGGATVGGTTVSLSNVDPMAGAAYQSLNGYVPGATTSTITLTADAEESALVAFNVKAAAGGGAYTLTCTQQSYALTGNATGLLAGRVLTATQQSYTLTGIAVTLTYTSSGAYTLTCTSQSYTLTGYDVALTPQSPPAVYVLTGNDVALLSSTRVLTCDVQTYALTGVATGFLTNRVLACVSAIYVLNWQATNLVYSNAPATSGIGTDSVRPMLRPYLGVKRRLAAYL